VVAPWLDISCAIYPRKGGTAELQCGDGGEGGRGGQSKGTVNICIYL
jgi:hypothetical protein